MSPSKQTQVIIDDVHQEIPEPIEDSILKEEKHYQYPAVIHGFRSKYRRHMGTKQFIKVCAKWVESITDPEKIDAAVEWINNEAHLIPERKDIALEMLNNHRPKELDDFKIEKKFGKVEIKIKQDATAKNSQGS